MEDFEGIQFIARLDNWACVKKLKKEKSMSDREIMEFLASLDMSAMQKFEELLESELDTEKIKTAVENTGACDAEKLLSEKEVKKAVKASVKNREQDKKILKELEGFAEVFALRHALKKQGVKIDYFEAEIPSMKKVKKLGKKVK